MPGVWFPVSSQTPDTRLMTLNFPATREKLHPSRSPVADGDLTPFDDNGYIPAAPAFTKHFIYLGAVLHNIPIIDLVTFFLVGLPGLRRVGSAEFSVDNDGAHGIPPVKVIVMVVEAFSSGTLWIIIDGIAIHFKVDWVFNLIKSWFCCFEPFARILQTIRPLFFLLL